MTDRQETRVLWLTNLPAPYRFPIWDRMAKDVRLKVIFLLKRKNWRNWPEPYGKDWKYGYLSFNSLRISEYDIIPSFRRARKILQDVDVAIIGGWESPIYIRTILLAKKLKIKVIQFYESTGDSHRFSKGPIAQFRKWILSKSDSIITISQSSAQSLNKMGIQPEHIKILFNPVDVQWFHDYANQNRVKESPGHKFIYVGQLIERKNVATILRSFAAIRKNDDILIIAGDGPLLRDLNNLAAYLRIAESVRFVGQQSQEELARLYAGSNTLILASTNEVWGLVVNEALAAGLHVIVTDKCGVAEFVKDMHGTYICSTNEESILEAMKKSVYFWSGYLKEPEILKFSPEKFADEVIHVAKSKLN